MRTNEERVVTAVGLLSTIQLESHESHSLFNPALAGGCAAMGSPVSAKARAREPPRMWRNSQAPHFPPIWSASGNCWNTGDSR